MRIKFPYVTLKRRAKIQAMREEIARNAKSWCAMEIMRVTKQEKCSHVIACLDDSKSQIQQDLFGAYQDELTYRIMLRQSFNKNASCCILSNGLYKPQKHHSWLGRIFDEFEFHDPTRW